MRERNARDALASVIWHHKPHLTEPIDTNHAVELAAAILAAGWVKGERAAGTHCSGCEGYCDNEGLTLRAEPGQIMLVRYKDGETEHQVVVDEHGQVVDRQSELRPRNAKPDSAPSGEESGPLPAANATSEPQDTP